MAESSSKRRAELCWRRERQLRMRGSRKGYNADIEVPGSTSRYSSDDDNDDDMSRTGAITSSSSDGYTNNSDHRFYSHVQPRRRRRRHNRNSTKRRTTRDTKGSSTQHPDIDLSLVSLLSSKELDRRFGYRSSGGGGNNNESSPSSSSSETGNDSSSSSGDNNTSPNKIKCCVNDTIIKTKKKSMPSDRPFAVIDNYGSIELDMKGSLLDSIYKITPGNSTSRRSGDNKGSSSRKDYSNDFMIGGRRYSLEEASTQANITAGGKERLSSLQHSQAFTVASNRSPEVEAVIASLKNRNKNKKRGRGSSMNSLEGSQICGTKKQKTDQSSTTNSEWQIFPTIDTMTSTLEDAISFSPFGRCVQVSILVFVSHSLMMSFLVRAHSDLFSCYSF